MDSVIQRPHGGGAERPQILPQQRGAARCQHAGGQGRGRRASSGRAARARPPSCAASTTWRRSTRGASTDRRRADGLPRGRGDKVIEDIGEEHRAHARGDRHGLPALQPLPAPDGAAERHGGAVSGEGDATRAGRGGARASCWRRSDSPRRPTPTPRGSRAASSSASPSRARWRWTPS